MSATPHGLRVALVNPALPGFGGLDYWLRLEQVVGDDRVTTDQVAEVVDELYGIEACRDQETQQEVKPEITWERLMEIARRILDPAECDRLRSGTYRAYVKVIVSHPNDKDFQYKLALTIGEIVSVQRMQEDVTKILQVRENEYVVLDVPVFQEPDQEWPGVAKWLGSVWNDENGAINAPTLSGFRNVVSWSGKASGTLQVKVPTVYDLVTIEVEGAPAPIGSLVGTTRDTTLRAFYHYQAYELDVDAPVMDETADGQTLAQVCGWDSLDGGGDDGNDGDGSDGDIDGDGDAGDDGDAPELGCLSPAPRLADPQFYRDTCCQSPPFGLPNCATYATTKPTQQLPQAVQDRYKRDHDGKVSFIAVGPGPDGCGRLIVHQQVNRRNCCNEVTPMSPHPDNPTSMGENAEITLEVLYGRDLVDSADFWEWTASGGLTFSGGKTSARAHRIMRVYSPTEWCKFGTVRVADGCGVLTMRVDNARPPEELSLSVDAEEEEYGGAMISLSGGTPPYHLVSTGAHTRWPNGEKEITLLSEGNVFLAVDEEQLCDGPFTVSAADSCTEVDSIDISPEDIPVGVVCIKYTSSFSSLSDWADNGCSPVATDPDMVRYSGLEAGYTYGSGVSCLPVGKFWSYGGSSAFLFVIGDPVGELYPITRYRLLGTSIETDFCIKCTA